MAAAIRTFILTMPDPVSRPDAPEGSDRKTRLVRTVGWTGSALAVFAFILAAVALSGHHWMAALALWVVSVVCLLTGWGLAAAVWWYKPAAPVKQPPDVELNQTRPTHER
jgi:hypothetical protein